MAELNAGNYGFSLSYPQGYEMVTVTAGNAGITGF